MTRMASRLLMIAATASMAFAPVAAQANTRASALSMSLGSGPIMSYASLLCITRSGVCNLEVRERGAPRPITPEIAAPETAAIEASGASGVAGGNDFAFLPFLLFVGSVVGAAAFFAGRDGAQNRVEGRRPEPQVFEMENPGQSVLANQSNGAN